jgi:hypothetical protein
MKHINNKLMTVMLISLVSMLSSCYNATNELEEGSDYKLTSQQEVDNFTVKSGIRTLTITGNDITDLSKLNFSTAVSVIIQNTAIDTLNLPVLSSIKSSLIISNNENLTSIKGLPKFNIMNGKIVIDGNSKLEDISGLLNLKLFIGSLSITNNVAFGKDVPFTGDYAYGLFPVKYLLEKQILSGSVVLANNNTEAAVDVSKIGQMKKGTILDYTFLSKTDLRNFVCADKDGRVNNLTIGGNDITNDDLLFLIGKITVVKGMFTLKNSSVTYPCNDGDKGFFSSIDFEGGLTVINNPFNNINIFKYFPDNFPGSIDIEDCNGIDFSWDPAGFQNIKTINGSLTIKNCEKFTDIGFKSLERVEGNLIIDKYTNLTASAEKLSIWNLEGMNLTYIGGDLVLKDLPHLNSFEGLKNITHIGGNITIENTGTIGDGYSDGTKPGYSWFKWAKKKGIISSDATISIKKPDGSTVDINSLPDIDY